jgi:hypothetical protein
VNAKGQVIGVSFAIPKSGESRDVHLDKFSYHVHCDELRAFLADRPRVPPIRVPDPWPQGAYVRLADLDADGVPDALVLAMEKSGPATGLLLDLNHSTDTKKVGAILDEFSKKDWRFQFAIHLDPVRHAFYDTDNDGSIDLILSERHSNGVVDEEYQLVDGTWRYRPNGGGKLIDPARFQNGALQERLQRILPLLTTHGSKMHRDSNGIEINKQ